MFLVTWLLKFMQKLWLPRNKFDNEIADNNQTLKSQNENSTEMKTRYSILNNAMRLFSSSEIEAWMNGVILGHSEGNIAFLIAMFAKRNSWEWK